MITKDKFHIGGRWVAPAGSGSIDVHAPADGALLARIPQGAKADADAAVAAARQAFDAWAATSPAERGEYLKKIHDGLKARGEEIARTITFEMGMPYKLSLRVQVGSPTATFGMYARMAGDFAFEEQVGHSKVLREPVGVVVAITPWNYPLHQIAAKVAAAMAAGCTLVLKPSEVAPLNAFALAEIIADAGVPPGVFNLVTGYGPEIGEALVTHPDVDMVSFTGSTAAGKRIAQLAAATVKRVALELGGKSASIVLDDADFGVAIKAVVNNGYLNSGQTCTAQTRLLVPARRFDEAAEIFGPVLSIIPYRDEDDAVGIANGTVYGLSGGVWSASDAHAENVARRLRTGQVDINGGPYNIMAPFGGYKQSGNGRELGKYGLEDFLEYKAMQFRPPKA